MGGKQEMSIRPSDDLKSQPQKRQKLSHVSNDALANEGSEQAPEYTRAKSKKELRAEKKAARRAAKPKSAEQLKVEKRRLAKEKRREEENQAFKEFLKQERKEKRQRQLKRENRQKNSRKGGGDVTGESASTKKKKEKPSNKNAFEQEVKETNDDAIAKKVLHEMKYGTTDASTNMTTLQSGVKYKDIVVGTGSLVQSRSLVTVQYKLTGGKFGALIDSSKKFNFRMGKGEVIRGWELGVAGMREGGRRKLIVPPKVGYGSQDIGAGPGGLLHFDITVLAVR